MDATTATLMPFGLAALLTLPATPALAQGALTPEQLTLRVERLTELSQRTESKLGSVQAQLKQLSEDMSRMSRLIDELLELSRVTRRVLKRERVNLSQMAREVLDELLLSMPERQVDVDIQSGLYVIADKELLHIVLTNLLENALKYTSREAHARIAVQQRSEQGQVVYAVEDNGVGFNQRESNKLFMPFQRLHRQDEFDGAGIGLATVARIIHRHGGGVWARGEVGKGATFLFSIPEA